MPWEEKTVEKLREEFVVAAEKCTNFSEVCRRFGISRQTGYKWLKRARNNEPLSDKCKVPFRIANKTLPDMEQKIVNMRLENPGWGGKKIHKVLLDNGVEDLPCSKTCCNILKRNGFISEEESLRHTPYKRFEKDYANEMWQIDFKGEFKTADGKWVFPFDVLDDKTRFCIMVKPVLNTANVVIPALEEAFHKYGIPKSILSDNGGQFARPGRGYTTFEKWLMDNDISPLHGRIVHPQTQGKIERFHGTMKRELLNFKTFLDINEAEDELNKWREKYNNVRPHESLNMKCPADVYTPSERKYTGIIKNYEYSGKYHIRKVNSWGYLRYAHWQLYMSETMINQHLEIRPNPHGDSFIVCYRNFRIAEYDAITGEPLNRKICKL